MGTERTDISPSNFVRFVQEDATKEAEEHLRIKTAELEARRRNYDRNFKVLEDLGIDEQFEQVADILKDTLGYRVKVQTSPRPEFDDTEAKLPEIIGDEDCSLMLTWDRVSHAADTDPIYINRGNIKVRVNGGILSIITGDGIQAQFAINEGVENKDNLNRALFQAYKHPANVGGISFS